MKHVLSASQFEDPALRAEIYALADYMRDHSETLDVRRELMATHAGLIVASIFYESSTRTRLSGEAAAHRLGMGVIGTENASKFSSIAKGETLEDSTRVIGGSRQGSGYADFIIMRHDKNGAAERAAAVSQVPVVNGGDGTNEHPTQALLDMYTINDELGRTTGLNVVFGGDLKHGRTARSLAWLLADPSNRVSFVSPPDLSMGDDIKKRLEECGVKVVETEDMFEVLGDADVVYWTRKQLERHQNGRLARLRKMTGRLGQLFGLERGPKRTIDPKYILGQTALDAMKEDAIILHPLPRVGEIETVVDKDKRGAYFRQADNGTFVRMALLHMLARERYPEEIPDLLAEAKQTV